MKALTVKDLYKECEKEIKRGNGDKVIMISSDDEGNSYHYLWFAFTPIKQLEQTITINGKKYNTSFIDYNEDVAKKEDTIILG